MSPRASRLTSSFVRRPERTGPETVRTAPFSRPGYAPLDEGAPTSGRRAPRGSGPGPAVRALGALGRVAAIAPARVTGARAKRHGIARSGRATQVARMSPRRAVGGVGAEHAHELGHHVALAELQHRGPRRRGGGVLDDREVTLGERRDLGEVGDAEELPVLRELTQARAHGAGGVTSDA